MVLGYGLVGPNGAGKSTILRHIMGIYRPDSGSVLVDGDQVYENPAVRALQQHLAVAEDAHVVAHVLQLPQVVGGDQHGGPPLGHILAAVGAVGRVLDVPAAPVYADPLFPRYWVVNRASRRIGRAWVQQAERLL